MVVHLEIRVQDLIPIQIVSWAAFTWNAFLPLWHHIKKLFCYSHTERVEDDRWREYKTSKVCNLLSRLVPIFAFHWRPGNILASNSSFNNWNLASVAQGWSSSWTATLFRSICSWLLLTNCFNPWRSVASIQGAWCGDWSPPPFHFCFCPSC